jgi:hypothetical protein
MSDSKKQNPYATPAHTSEANSDWKSGSLLWIVPGGASGAIIGACLIRRPDELFRDHSLIVMILMLGMWGFIGLLGSMVWRFDDNECLGSLSNAIRRIRCLARWLTCHQEFRRSPAPLLIVPIVPAALCYPLVVFPRVTGCSARGHFNGYRLAEEPSIEVTDRRPARTGRGGRAGLHFLGNASCRSLLRS